MNQLAYNEVMERLPEDVYARVTGWGTKRHVLTGDTEVMMHGINLDDKPWELLIVVPRKGSVESAIDVMIEDAIKLTRSKEGAI